MGETKKSNSIRAQKSAERDIIERYRKALHSLLFENKKLPFDIAKASHADVVAFKARCESLASQSYFIRNAPGSHHSLNSLRKVTAKLAALAKEFNLDITHDQHPAS